MESQNTENLDPRIDQKNLSPEQLEIALYTKQLEDVTAHPENVNQISKLLIAIDKSYLMSKFRNFWDELPHLAQWALMHSTKGPMLFSGKGPMQALIKAGFITYKGHLDENGQIMEEEIQAMGGMDKYLLKYGVKFGKYFIPELAELEPLVEPLLKLEGEIDNAFTKLRHQVKAAREKREAPEKNIENISSATRDNLQVQLPEDLINTNLFGQIEPLSDSVKIPKGLPRQPSQHN